MTYLKAVVVSTGIKMNAVFKWVVRLYAALHIGRIPSGKCIHKTKKWCVQLCAGNGPSLVFVILIQHNLLFPFHLIYTFIFICQLLLICADPEPWLGQPVVLGTWILIIIFFVQRKSLNHFMWTNKISLNCVQCIGDSSRSAFSGRHI